MARYVASLSAYNGDKPACSRRGTSGRSQFLMESVLLLWFLLFCCGEFPVCAAVQPATTSSGHSSYGSSARISTRGLTRSQARKRRRAAAFLPGPNALSEDSAFGQLSTVVRAVDNVRLPRDSFWP